MTPALQQSLAALVCVCLATAAQLFSSFALATELSDRKCVEQLVAQVDAGDSPSALVQFVGERGIGAALVCAEFLDERKPRRSQFLYEAIAVAGNCRRSHTEILWLYQPEAFRLFYTADGIAGQRKLATGLAWK